MPSEFGPWSSAMSTGIRVELNTFWKKRLIMLPSLVVSGSEMSFRGNLTFLCCALILLGLPTFYGVAQSQEAEPPVAIKSADENPDPAVKDATVGQPTEQQPTRASDETSIAELVARFNKLVKSQEYGEAKLIARMVEEIDPHDPLGKIMLWKATYRLGEIKTYSSGGNDGKASGSETPTGSIPRRPSSPLKAPRHDAAERTARKSRLLKDESGNPRRPDTTLATGVDEIVALPATDATRSKIPVSPAMAKLVDQYNGALSERRYEAAIDIAKTANLLAPGDPSAEIMLWKATFALRVSPPSVDFLPRPSAETQRIVQVLEDKTSFHFEDIRLTEAVKKIAQHHKINIVIDPTFFSADKADENTRVTLKVDGISLRTALKLMLSSAQLSYAVEHEVLIILPQDAAARKTITLIYPVQDLVGDSGDFQSLVTAIAESVGRGTWHRAGTEISQMIGTISEVPASGSLVIHHNWETHSKVLELLRTLRQAKSIQSITP